tara:strand:+ start:412 stop:834 length:423 start_codon:yes stop_codon:yes gene_type:complete
MISITVYFHPIIQITTLLLGFYVLKLGLKLRKSRLEKSTDSRSVLLKRHIRLAKIFIILFTIGYLLGLIEMKFVLKKPIYNSLHSFLATITLSFLYLTAFLGRSIRKRQNEKFREIHRFCAFIGIFFALITGFAGIGLLP